MKSKSRVLSLIQPTNEMHLGNYFGAVKNWVNLQEKYECFYGIADYHAMTMPFKAKDLLANSWKMVVDLMAAGVDPDKSHLFIQSMVPEHTELNWILGCFCSYGELQRMTQFKDKSESEKLQEKGTIVSTGLFTYPVLQAADILIYKAEFVPVGRDQVQHLELSRNIANRFNHLQGEVFVEPKPLFTETQKLLSLADPTKKMSKSLGDNHVVRLFEEEASVRKKIRTAVTDTGEKTDEMSPGVSNLFTLLKACGREEAYDSLMEDYRNGALKYSLLKGELTDAVVELTSGFITRKTELLSRESKIMDRIYEVSKKVRAVARETLDQTREAVGIPPMRY